MSTHDSNCGSRTGFGPLHHNHLTVNDCPTFCFCADLFTQSTTTLPSGGMLLPTADPRRKPLTEAGGFHIVRHPQYAGLLALCLSVCLLSQSADRLFYTMLLMIVLDKKADLEEQAISEEVGGGIERILLFPHLASVR